jgi:hypothetical protein
MNNGSLALNLIYLEIKSIGRGACKRSLTEQKALLSSDLNAVIEGLRMNPDNIQ